MAVTLRPFRRSDLDDFAAYWCLPEVAQWMPWSVGDRVAAQRALLERVLGRAVNQAGDCRWSAITDGDTVIGEVALHWRRSGQGEIAYSLHPAFQGRGIATDAAAQMLRVGFDELGLDRICGACDPANDRSARLLQRLGMQLDAARAAELIESEWEALSVYAMSRDDWARKAA